MKGETKTLALDDGVCETVKGEVEPEALLDGEGEMVKGDPDTLKLPLVLAEKLGETVYGDTLALAVDEGELVCDGGAQERRMMLPAPPEGSRARLPFCATAAPAPASDALPSHAKPAIEVLRKLEPPPPPLPFIFAPSLPAILLLQAPPPPPKKPPPPPPPFLCGLTTLPKAPEGPPQPPPGMEPP